jgi:hypothetical protein
LTSILIEPALTIIGYFYQKRFAKERGSLVREKKLQKWKEKIIVDVNAIMWKIRKKGYEHHQQPQTK